jgi:hypothetical protein
VKVDEEEEEEARDMAADVSGEEESSDYHERTRARLKHGCLSWLAVIPC